MHTLCIVTKLQIGEAVMCPGLEWWVYHRYLTRHGIGTLM